MLINVKEKKMKKIYAVFLIPLLCMLSVCSFAQDVSKNVQRKVTQAQLAKSAQVELKLAWKKQDYLERRVRFHPGRKIRVSYPAQYKTTQCAGVLLTQARVATAASCLQDGDGFQLEQITLTFSNGKSGSVLAPSVRVTDGIAHITVDPALTEGLMGMEVASVPNGSSLQDVYGKDFSSALQNFLISRGVVSDRASRLTGRKASIKKGEPFFWNGKLVAVFNKVPRRLPTALFGQISEDFLAVFHR